MWFFKGLIEFLALSFAFGYVGYFSYNKGKYDATKRFVERENKRLDELVELTKELF